MGIYTAHCCGLLLVFLLQVHARPSAQQNLQDLTQRLEEVERFLTDEEAEAEADDTSPIDTSFHLQDGQRELERGWDRDSQDLESRHTVSDGSLLRILQDIANGPLRSRSRSKKGSSRGCFGMKLDRIGAMSSLGC
ncbi:C-type natriuretic peptide-like [Leucoraja erinacea]|uniref:C-type natriuretic peptide-like n=1 Tax=Leucoraja erinaceus TaxID=7782 RepID=UPI0024540D95|nr:C-type natriuretic peptide-like [Leucoraja erinacea]